MAPEQKNELLVAQTLTMVPEIDTSTEAKVLDSLNAMGASAVDALRAASPFPPMPDQVRCLSQHSLIGTFSNPFAGCGWGRLFFAGANPCQFSSDAAGRIE